MMPLRIQKIHKIIKSQFTDVNVLSASIVQFHIISSNKCGCGSVHYTFPQPLVQVEPLAKPQAHNFKVTSNTNISSSDIILTISQSARFPLVRQTEGAGGGGAQGV